MTDKVQKIRKEVKRLMYGFNLEVDIASCENAEAEKIADIKYRLCKKILDYIDEVQKEPIGKGLGEYINELSKQFPEVSFAKLSRIAVRVTKWQKEQMMTKAVDGTARPDDNEIWCNLDFFNLEDGDKVKVIVIKED